MVNSVIVHGENTEQKTMRMACPTLAGGIDSDKEDGDTQSVAYNSQGGSNTDSEGEDVMYDGTRRPQANVIYERRVSPDNCEQLEGDSPITTTVTANGTYMDEGSRMQVPSHILWYPADYHFPGHQFDSSVVSNLEQHALSLVAVLGARHKRSLS